MAEVCFYRNGLPPCWSRFCVYSRTNFKTKTEIVEYLNRFDAEWRPMSSEGYDPSLGGWILKFKSEEGYNMFLLRWGA